MTERGRSQRNTEVISPSRRHSSSHRSMSGLGSAQHRAWPLRCRRARHSRARHHAPRGLGAAHQREPAVGGRGRLRGDLGLLLWPKNTWWPASTNRWRIRSVRATSSLAWLTRPPPRGPLRIRVWCWGRPDDRWRDACTTRWRCWSSCSWWWSSSPSGCWSTSTTMSPSGWWSMWWFRMGSRPPGRPVCLFGLLHRQ